LNIVGMSFIPIEGLTAHGLLRHLRDQAGGDTDVVGSIQRYNTETGQWEMVSWLDGEPGNGDFPIRAGEAYLVYMGWDVYNLWFEGVAHGAAVHLATGLNLVTLPTTRLPVEFDSYDMLVNVGTESEISSVKRYDDIWGWQTTSWFSGSPSGKNFDTTMGEGYLIYMKEDKANWRPY
jgi:hypothetical protein